MEHLNAEREREHTHKKFINYNDMFGYLNYKNLNSIFMVFEYHQIYKSSHSIHPLHIILYYSPLILDICHNTLRPKFLHYRRLCADRPDTLSSCLLQRNSWVVRSVSVSLDNLERSVGLIFANPSDMRVSILLTSPLDLSSTSRLLCSRHRQHFL